MGSMKEIGLVRSPRPLLANTLDAAKRGNAVGTRAAFRAYDSAWHGIEVYVSTRSRPLYLEIEDGRKKIDQLLRPSRPNLVEIVPLVKAMLAKFDEAITNSETDPAISPLFDDVAAIRMARAELRAAGPALKAGNLGQARSSFDAFQKAWPSVKGMIHQRSPDTCKEIEDAIVRVDTAFQHRKSTAAELIPLVDRLMEGYNVGLSVVVAEASETTSG